MPEPSSIQNGWHWDSANSRLEFFYRGTKVGHLSASGFSITDDTTARMTDGLPSTDDLPHLDGGLRRGSDVLLEGNHGE